MKQACRLRRICSAAVPWLVRTLEAMPEPLWYLVMWLLAVLVLGWWLG